MITFKNGILKISYDGDNVAKRLYEAVFALNILTLFVFYQVKMISPIMGLILLAVSIFILVRRKNSHIVIPYNSIWYLTLIAYSCLSCLWASYVYGNFLSMIIRMVIILATITSISIYVETPEDLERLMTVFILSVLTIVSIELIYVPVNSWFNGLMGSHFSGYNANEAALLAVCAEMLALYKFYIKGQKIYMLLPLFFVFFVVLTSSRKALVAAVAGPIILIFFSTYKKNYFLKLILIIAFAIGIVYFIMNNEYTYQIIGKRFVSMINFMQTDIRKYDNSMYLRQYYIDVAKKMFTQSPLLGRGFGNFSYVVSNEYGETMTYSHNNFWQLLSELGIIGFIIYYSFHVFCAVRFIRNIVVNKSKVSILFLTMLILFVGMDVGLVSFDIKTEQMFLGLAFAATFVGSDDGRQFKYIENNKNKLED